MVDKFKKEHLETLEKDKLIEHCLALQAENWEFQKAYYVKPRRRIYC